MLVILPLIIAALLTVEDFAYAVDPFTVMAVVNTTAQVVSQVSEATGDVAASTQAFNELYSEVDSDAQVTQSGQKMIRGIEEVDALAHEAGYSASEVDQLGHPNAEEIRKLSGSIHAVTQAVRAGKRVAKLGMKLVQKSQLAQVESAELQKQQLAETYKIAELQSEANLAALKTRLRELIDKKNQISALKQALKDKGVQEFGKTGVLSFPKTKAIMEQAITVANRLKPALISLMLTVFLMRVVFYQFGLFSIARYGDLMRDTLICSLLLFIFPEIIRASVEISQSLASQIGDVNLQPIDPKHLDLPRFGGVSTPTMLGIAWVVGWIKYATFTVIDFVMTFGLSFLVMIFPVVIFCSQMLNFAVAWPIFMGSFLVLAMWPVFWNLVGLAGALSWSAHDGGITDYVYSFLLTLLQFLSPYIGVKLLSGQSLHKAVTGGVASVMSPARALATNAQEGGAGAVSTAKGETPVGASNSMGQKFAGRLMGSAVGGAANQLASRSLNSADSRAGKLDYSEMQSPRPTRTSVTQRALGFALNHPASTVSDSNQGSYAAKFFRGLKTQPLSKGRTRS